MSTLFDMWLDAKIKMTNKAQSQKYEAKKIAGTDEDSTDTTIKTMTRWLGRLLKELKTDTKDQNVQYMKGLITDWLPDMDINQNDFVLSKMKDPLQSLDQITAMQECLDKIQKSNTVSNEIHAAGNNALYRVEFIQTQLRKFITGEEQLQQLQTKVSELKKAKDEAALKAEAKAARKATSLPIGPSDPGTEHSRFHTPSNAKAFNLFKVPVRGGSHYTRANYSPTSSTSLRF